MMNRFVTLLLAASCLTAVGQVTYCLDGTVWDALDTVRVQCLEICQLNATLILAKSIHLVLEDSTIYVCELSASETIVRAFVV